MCVSQSPVFTPIFGKGDVFSKGFVTLLFLRTLGVFTSSGLTPIKEAYFDNLLEAVFLRPLTISFDVVDLVSLLFLTGESALGEGVPSYPLAEESLLLVTPERLTVVVFRFIKVIVEPPLIESLFPPLDPFPPLIFILCYYLNKLTPSLI
jgi:hypothetical protein